jgi:hypothetical protein
MQKTAQKRSILNKLREMSNVSGIAAEKFFNPEFERVMNSLRTADAKIRAIATGTEIEGEDPGDPTSLKELLKGAKSNLNRREYMTSIAFLGRFHKKLYDIIQVIDGLNTDVDQVHHDFLFKDLDEDQKKHLSEMKGRFAAVRGYGLIAEAGIMDFLHNISSDRGKALAAWEKRYPKQVKKLKTDTSNLIVKSENVLSALISSMKEMASARATRKVDDYVAAAAKVSSIYNNYDKIFRDHYNSNVKGFLEKQEMLSPTKKVEDKELNKQEIEPPVTMPPPPQVEEHEDNIPINLVPNTIPAPSRNEELENAFENINTPNSGSFTPPKLPADMVPPTSVTSPEETESSESEEILPPKNSHKKFIDSLESMADEKPALIAAHIRRYAKSIQSSDLETTVKLLKLAKSIKE